MNKLISMLIVSLAALISFLAYNSCSSKKVDKESTETRIEISELPSSVLKHIETNYPGSKLIEAEIEQKGDEQNYEVDILFEGTDVELEFSMNGELLEQEINED